MDGQDERAKCTYSLHHRAIYQDKVTSKKQQLIDAVAYCRENKCRGFKAKRSGLFPLIKSHLTINNILDGKSKEPHASREYCSVLTAEEEKLLASYIVSKARAYQPVNRKDLTKHIIKMLQLRKAVNKSGGRKFKKLSPAATRVLSSKSLSRKFWERFEAKHKSILRKKRRGSTSIKRVTACTKVMAIEHMDEEC